MALISMPSGEAAPCVGYLMAKTVDIKNFRSFDSASLGDCRRMNFLVGDNGSGKTALLEGIFLAAGPTPEIALRVKGWRGMEVGGGGTPRQIAASIWGDLFHNFEMKDQIWIRLGGTPAHNRTVRVFPRPTEVSVNLKKGRGTIEAGEDSDAMRFHWKGPRAEDKIIDAKLEEGKLKFSAGAQSIIQCAFFAANHTYSTSEAVARFSELSKMSRESEVISHFIRQFPMIEGLSIEVSGATPMIYARVPPLPQKLPVNLISGGLNKLAAILFAIPEIKGGIILIDELENGFYYKKFGEIVSAIEYFATQYDVQIFASTHSGEMLHAASTLARKSPENYSLIRAVRKNGATQLRQFSGQDFADAVDEDIEVR